MHTESHCRVFKLYRCRRLVFIVLELAINFEYAAFALKKYKCAD
jgi:hypothetical protein